MNYISLQEAAEIGSQDVQTILDVVRLVEDGHFPANTIKRYYSDERWQVYIDADFVRSRFVSSTITSAARKDPFGLVGAAAFVAVFALIWYVGSSLAATRSENLRLQKANELQRKALDDAYNLIMRDRENLGQQFSMSSGHALNLERLLAAEVATVEINLSALSPEKVAVE